MEDWLGTIEEQEEFLELTQGYVDSEERNGDYQPQDQQEQYQEPAEEQVM